ncbi:MAG: elongation factor 1-beta [Methanobacteriota archaeon]
MGQVLVAMNVAPEDVSTDLRKIEDGIRKVIPGNVKLRGLSIVPVAFGLKAIKLALQMEDGEANPDDIEAAIGNIPGVGSVQVTGVDLL